MKVEQKEREVYIACDGTEFDTQNDCLNYENTYKMAILKMFNNIPYKEFLCNTANEDLSEEASYRIVYPRDMNDVLVMNMFIEQMSPHSKKRPDNPHEHYVFYVTYDNDIFYEDSVTNIVDKFNKAFND